MSDHFPTVSVVVTAYNQEKYITDALESVLAQTYRDYEVVVVDDGSTDATAERIAAFVPSVRLIRQANQGIAGSRNSGILRARGRLIAFLDGDDLWEPDKLARQVAAADDNPMSGLIAVNGKRMGHPAGLETLFPRKLERLLDGQDSVTFRAYELFLDGNVISTVSQVMVPRHVLRDIGPSDQDFPISSDWDLYIRISARYEVTLLSPRLVTWRYVESSASGPLPIRQLRYGEDGIAILRKHLHSVPTAQKSLVQSEIRRRILTTATGAYYFGKQGSRTVARRHLLRLLWRNPESAGTILFFLVGLHCPDFMIRSVGWLRRSRGARVARSR